MTNGTVFSGWFEPSRPSPSRTNFRAKIPNKQGNQKMADSLFILLALELLDDYEVEISEVLDEDDEITKVCRASGAKVVQKNIQVICRIITSGTLILSRRIGSHVEFDLFSGLCETGREQEWSNEREFSGYSDFPEF